MHQILQQHQGPKNHQQQQGQNSGFITPLTRSPNIVVDEYRGDDIILPVQALREKAAASPRAYNNQDPTIHQQLPATDSAELPYQAVVSPVVDLRQDAELHLDDITTSSFRRTVATILHGLTEGAITSLDEVNLPPPDLSTVRHVNFFTATAPNPNIGRTHHQLTTRRPLLRNQPHQTNTFIAVSPTFTDLPHAKQSLKVAAPHQTLNTAVPQHLIKANPHFGFSIAPQHTIGTTVQQRVSNKNQQTRTLTPKQIQQSNLHQNLQVSPQQNIKTLSQQSLQNFPQQNLNTLPRQSFQTFPHQSRQVIPDQIVKTILLNQRLQESPRQSTQDIPQQSQPISPQHQSQPISPQHQSQPISPQHQNLPINPQQSLPISPQQSLPISPQQSLPVSPQQSLLVSPQHSQQDSSQQSLQGSPKQNEPVIPQQSLSINPQQSLQFGSQQKLQGNLQPTLPFGDNFNKENFGNDKLIALGKTVEGASLVLTDPVTGDGSEATTSLNVKSVGQVSKVTQPLPPQKATSPGPIFTFKGELGLGASLDGGVPLSAAANKDLKSFGNVQSVVLPTPTGTTTTFPTQTGNLGVTSGGGVPSFGVPLSATRPQISDPNFSQQSVSTSIGNQGAQGVPLPSLGS